MSTGYQPLATSADQDAVLAAIEARAAPGAVCVFDLDGCLFDTRYRQVHLFAQLGALIDAPDLSRVRVEHFEDWDLAATLRRAGIATDQVDALMPELRAWFMEHFFTSRAVGLDHAMPGGARLVRACSRRGAHIVYLTGRHTPMREGTERALLEWGFPWQDGGSTLLMKRAASTSDTEFKADALGLLQRLGQPAVFLDNEPSNVNLFHARFPDALTVFVRTDHSPRPIVPDPSLPVVRGFLRQQEP
jgi:hypothetical protein